MGPFLFAVAAGFGTGLSLIVAIGAQNAFVLRQGIQRHAVPLIVAICAGSDAVLIALGVAGVGVVVGAWPAATTVLTLVGAAFLLGYAFLAARRALRPSVLVAAGGSARPAVLTAVALTWLNPHVYVDVLLLGSLAAAHGSLRWGFAVGAVLASLCWFSALGFGARLLTGFFAKPASWKVLDGLVAATMLAFGVLLLSQLR
ncbi:LysE/ArgO family amino acid transporter [Actinokineospora xionganensis]|uniref:LysE family transporter n=1 Tax=Actinokineospora xionganensis TaxID=2684470 RepID=A0ABR7L0B2_9PSEU|nr:LysE family transporter [Actinokineospora xionganensis]MBC6446085.1 LysE family transporter [Actinokineospora xionganensis]